jgi:hypothetical protein
VITTLLHITKFGLETCNNIIIHMTKFLSRVYKYGRFVLWQPRRTVTPKESYIRVIDQDTAGVVNCRVEGCSILKAGS